MIETLQRIRDVLARVNSSLSTPIVQLESVEDESYHLEQLKKRKKEFNRLLTQLDTTEFKDQESAAKAFLPVYSYLSYTLNITHSIYHFTRSISSNYADRQKLNTLENNDR